MTPTNEGFPPGYCGCADTLKPDDERLPRFARQRADRGFDDTETWSLEHSIAKLVLPRLRRFREIHRGYQPPCESMEEWDAILDRMIAGFEAIAGDGYPISLSRDEWEAAESGLDLFHEWFFRLWH